MTRRFWLALLVAAAFLIGLVPAAAAATPPLPASIAAVGDSITQAASTGGSLGADYPQNSWSTGTNTAVNSHYLRLLALNSAISGRNYNRSVSGAKMVDLNGQMQNVVALQPDYLTVLIGGNDLCTDTAPGMTSVSAFRTQFEAAMATLAAGSPNTNIYVSSIPNVYHLWELFKGDFWARFIWSVGNICQSLLANPTSTTQTDVARRAAVAQRNVDFNTQLAQVCAAYIHCRWDGNAAFNTVFTTSDAAGDYFHPSISGQAKLASVSWAASYWPNGAPPPPAGTASIGGLSSSAATRKGGWTANVTISVRDAQLAPVSGATVNGTWSTGAASTCTTSAAGTCSVSLNLGKKATTVTWTVGGVTHATLTYDPGGNVASAITVNMP